MIFFYEYGEPDPVEGGMQITGLPAFCLMVIVVLLLPVSEALWGQTLGKRVLNVRVTTMDGKPISFLQALVRFGFAMIDCSCLLGYIVILTNKQRQRLGDLVAQTVVVKNSVS